MDVVVPPVIRNLNMNSEMMSAYATALLARSYIKVKLFNTNQVIAPNTPLSALTEANYSGYAPITVSALNGPAENSIFTTYLTSNLCFFTNNGGGVGNIIYSAGIVGNIPGSTDATGTVTTTGGVISAPTITAGGSGYLVAPNVTVLGGGTGAVVTATITAGVVTALTLVSGGTGYTAATLVIDPPLELVAGGNLPNPIPMNVSTDALPIVMEIPLSVAA